MVLHFPSPPWTMLATTQWVWSCGSRLRDVSWRNVAAAIFCSPARTIAPVAGSRIRGSTALPSIQASVLPTALSWASTIRSSPPTIAMSETDFAPIASRRGRAGDGLCRPSPCARAAARRGPRLRGPAGTPPARPGRRARAPPRPCPPRRSPRGGPRRPSRSTHPSRNSSRPAPARRSCRSTLPLRSCSGERAFRWIWRVHAAQIRASPAENKMPTSPFARLSAHGADCHLPQEKHR